MKAGIDPTGKEAILLSIFEIVGTFKEGGRTNFGELIEINAKYIVW